MAADYGVKCLAEGAKNGSALNRQGNADPELGEDEVFAAVVHMILGTLGSKFIDQIDNSIQLWCCVFPCHFSLSEFQDVPEFVSVSIGPLSMVTGLLWLERLTTD